MQPKVLITALAHEVLATTLQNYGFKVLYQPNIPEAELQQLLPQLHGLIVTTRAITAQHINAATQLQFIGRLGSGLELIDVAYAQSKGIKCVSSPEGNANAVAEHCLGLLLSILNNLHFAANQVTKGIWQRNQNRGTELFGKTVGIIGFGNTGSQFAKVLQGFNVTILAHDLYHHGFATGNIKEANLEQIQKFADVISFHLPLKPETQHYANAAFFEVCKNQPIILNTSRGNVIHTPALLHALQNNQITGAGLDVLENENLTTYTPAENQTLQQLLQHKNVIVTPHIAGYSHQALYKMAKKVLEKLNF
jgi:D-3-phosphoglycerate dehydrogenase / 2-oxoglutarate reductase